MFSALLVCVCVSVFGIEFVCLCVCACVCMFVIEFVCVCVCMLSALLVCVCVCYNTNYESATFMHRATDSGLSVEISLPPRPWDS